MAGYNLYKSQDLDPTHSCEELLADLAGRNWGLPDGAQRAQLNVARQVLGNPVRRDMYDKQLGDATVTVSREDVERLASLDIGDNDVLVADGISREDEPSTDDDAEGIFAESKGLIAVAAALVIVVIGIMAVLFFGGGW